MNRFVRLTPRATRAWVAGIGAAGLIGGAAWSGLAATPRAADEAVAQKPTTIAHPLAAGRDSYADVVDIVSPAVVTVHATGKARASQTQFQVPDDFFEQFFGRQGQRSPFDTPRGRQPRVSALGSGVVVTGDGYILTNNHVIDGADEVSVDFTDGRTFTAKIVGTDKPSDLALLKIEGSNFHSLTLGDSDAVKVGDVVLAVGNPLNVGQTVTMGIISAKGRSTGVGNGSYEDFLQTDAPINHGNSGGALVNMKGELIGINSQILSNSDGNIGIGFAIPANMARHVMTDLRTKGKVTRAQLGVTVQTISPDMADALGLKDSRGVVVSSVGEGSAAEKAGVKRGDVIKSLNGEEVHDINSLRNRIAQSDPGSTAELKIVRDGAEKQLNVKLEAVDGRTAALNGNEGNGETDSSRKDDRAALGVTVAPLTPELANQLDLDGDTKGVVVRDVDPDGRSADVLRSGDVIKEVNRRPVDSVDALRSALNQTADKTVLLLINRQGNDIFVAVKPASNG
jgi:Do/DeqQ family serine protease